ncbi:MAG: sulfur carrier protein ThiS [Candidatus Dormiibacterota bacterium]
MSSGAGPSPAVVVNGSTRRVAPGSSVADLVESLGRGSEGIAVAVNLEVVSRSRWSETRLGDGDRVEIMTAAQGG